MIEQMLMPLDRHYDDGLAATGDAFKESAEKLIEVQEADLGLINGHLPINYLLRHAIELYLKSSILTVHRFFKLATGDGPHQREPLIKVEDKWKPLHSTHSLKTLLGELERLISENKSRFKMHTDSSWNTPPDLVVSIDTIDATDGGSTYFRYPKSKGSKVDSEKSGSLRVNPEQIVAEMHERASNGKKGRVVLAMKDDDGNIVETFAMQENPLPELREALINAAKSTSGCAIGLHMELVNGYGRKLRAMFAEKKQASIEQS